MPRVHHRLGVRNTRENPLALLLGMEKMHFSTFQQAV